MTYILLGAILGPFYFVLGLSFLVYAKTWTELVKDWSKNHSHLLTMALVQFIFGMVILLYHNKWEWSPWLIITLSGWLMVIESVFYLLAPGEVIKNTLKSINKVAFFQVSGVVMLLLGAALSFLVF